MAKLIHGIGYNSKRKHQTHTNGKVSLAYSQWHHMIQRCYASNRTVKNKSYVGCSASEEWYDFQNFADWFYGQAYYDADYQLDKDLLLPGNKIYNPKDCALIPRQLNTLLTDRRAARGNLPQGVDFNKASGRYRSRLSVDGRSCSLGYFDCPNEAYKIYKAAKERHVKNMALKWANRIEWNVFVALMNWTLDN